MSTRDQLGNDAYEGDWNSTCGRDDTSSDGDRVTSAKALQIAADVLRSQLYAGTHKWTGDDIVLALGAIAGIRAQRGCEELMDEGRAYLTEVMDIVIYG